MNKEAEQAMNNLHVSEMLALNTEGFILICGNGQACAIVEEKDAPRAEMERVKYGY
ncbi:MAG: hypothetical protein J5787_05920 [Alphaproteobacteria bacterium]|nr:hypothetical protein [Alphaproteobacteria bacterium]